MELGRVYEMKTIFTGGLSGVLTTVVVVVVDTISDYTYLALSLSLETAVLSGYTSFALAEYENTQ